MRNRRAVFLAAVAALTLTGGLAACGGDGVDKAKIEADINAGNAAANTFPDAANAAAEREQQANADEDQKEAQRALDRRDELAKLEAEQKAETARLMEEGVAGGNDEDAEIPIGSADPEVERFRARLAGVCAGGQKRLVAVSEDAQKAAKSKDPLKILKSAQEYSDAVNDFMAALTELDAPRSVRADYRSWLATIGALGNNVRLQVVSYADPERSERLAKKTQSLFEELVIKSATLGVTCVTATA